MAPAKNISLTLKHVFFASPGDVAKERQLFPGILDRINVSKAHAMGIHLEQAGWETTLPNMGRAQGLINEQLAECELFIMLLWRRWGIPPGGDRYTSGTEEEFEVARELNRTTGLPAIQLYFRDVPPDALADPGDQLKQVLAFRTKIEKEHVLLYSRYGEVDDWERMVEKNIFLWLDTADPAASGKKQAAEPAPAENRERLHIRQAEVEAASVEEAKNASIDLARQASAAAGKGLFTEAEQLYARAVQAYPDLSVVSDLGYFYSQRGSTDRAELQFRELFQLAVKQGNRFYANSAVRMVDQLSPRAAPQGAYEVLQRKADGLPLAKRDIDYLVGGFTSLGIREAQVAAFLMAAYIRGLDLIETRDFTHALVHSGNVLDLSEFPQPKVDKHSTGGVGDKTALIVGPAAAAGGCIVPMITGRGLGHIGGTLDKAQSIPGLKTAYSLSGMQQLLRRAGLAIVRQPADFVPADRALYALRDATATITSPALVISSILSKKLAEDLNGLVFDVKVGGAAFMKRIEDGRELARQLVELGSLFNVRVSALLTRLHQPLGRAIGNSLEVKEAIAVMKGRGPADVVAASRELTAHMFVAGGVESSLESGRSRFEYLIAKGLALEKFAAFVDAQEGDPRIVDDESRMGAAKYQSPVAADRSGFVAELKAEAFGIAAMEAGATTAVPGAAVDPTAGITIERQVGEPVNAGEVLCTIHANDMERLNQARNALSSAIRIADAPPPAEALIIEVLAPREA